MMKKKTVKKYQPGKQVDSTKYYNDQSDFLARRAVIEAGAGAKKTAEKSMKEAREAKKNASRQQFKGKPGFDSMGNPVNKKGGKVKSKKK